MRASCVRAVVGRSDRDVASRSDRERHHHRCPLHWSRASRAFCAYAVVGRAVGCCRRANTRSSRALVGSQWFFQRRSGRAVRRALGSHRARSRQDRTNSSGRRPRSVTICGRKSILSPEVLDPKDLTFKGARVQRLRRDERDKAASLSATPAADAPLKSLGRVLQAAAASTAIGAPGALTDGDPETTWSEKRGGDGNGEFVQINAPEQVEISSLSIVPARPPKKFPRERARERSGSPRATRSLR